MVVNEASGDEGRMFSALSDKLESVFKKLRGHGKLTESNIKDSMREVRQALLEADVNYKVVKQFTAAVEAKAIGIEVLQSVDPGQQIVKVVYDELVALLGGDTAPLAPIDRLPTIYMVCGLQGSGKTTLSGKLALQAKRRNKKPLLVAADIYRPAAVKQLKVLADQIGVSHFSIDGKQPAEICREGVRFAEKNFIDLVILDTAGRLHIDDQLMQELEEIKALVGPHEILLVVDSMTGQDAVTVADQFHKRLAVTGVALTKLDGDSRGGSALSIRSVTGCPIKLASTGEKLSDLEPFHPDRLASRILGMGDIVSLVEKAQETIDVDQAARMQQKLLKSQFDLDDFLQQMNQLKKLGSFESVLQMIPGVGKALKGVQINEQEMERTAAIIKSMTMQERRQPSILNGSRRKRIALGSGTSVQEVNQLVKQFTDMQRMMSSIGNNKKRLMQLSRSMRAR